MAAGALAEEVSKALEAQATGKAGRKELLRVSGQLLVIDSERFKQILKDTLPGIKDLAVTNIWKKWDLWLAGRVKNVKEERRKELLKAAFNLKMSNKLNPNEVVYVIGSYKNIANEKGHNGVLGRIVKEEHDPTEDELKSLGGMGGTGGGVLGHEESGRGISQAGVAALKAESIISQSNLSPADKAILNKAILEFKENVTVSMEHVQVVNGDKIDIKYIPILTWQSETTNASMAKAEAKALSALQEKFKNFATMEGSTPFVDAVSQVLLYGVSPKKRNKNIKTTGKKTKQIKERSKGSKKAQIKNKENTPFIRDTGINRNKIAKLSAKRQQFNPLQLVGMINDKLSQTVRKNMGSPRLENTSGRFANSVRIKNIAQTKKGFLSFGYSYDKNPYQVFEVGTGREPWANPQRDPRQLIDRSIREVAAQFALGRFYTRRL